MSCPRGHALLISIEKFTKDSGLANREVTSIHFNL